VLHPRVDLGLVLCGFGFHDPKLVVERSEFTRRTVSYSRCVRCERVVRGAKRQDEQAPARRSSHYT
jgi:hypothetical protein